MDVCCTNLHVCVCVVCVLTASMKSLTLLPEEFISYSRISTQMMNSWHSCRPSYRWPLTSDPSPVWFMKCNMFVLMSQSCLIMCRVFQSATEALEDLRTSIDEVQKEGDALINFFCEDRDVFKLDECFRIFQNFCSKFKKAVQVKQIQKTLHFFFPCHAWKYIYSLKTQFRVIIRVTV